ncbi:hypothetical protein QUF73_18330 [Cytobacillus sp. NJ13]|nr:hypothetical protein [Cytobacillus sp. NJ13]
MKAYLEKRKRLAHPRQAQDEPPGKAFFAFLGGLACDLEEVGAGARQLLTFKILYFFRKKRVPNHGDSALFL